MKVLVACEYSGIVRDAFTARGHDAMSCDLLPTESPGPHYQGDVMDILNDGWDMMIAFPPCTHIALSGAAHFAEKRKDGRQKQGVDFFMAMTKTKIPKWCIENPMNIMSRIYRKPDQIINPWQFGDHFQKTTWLWLHNIPKLIPSEMDAPLFGMEVNKGEFITNGKYSKMPVWYVRATQKERSRFWPSIAKAMAERWG